MMQDAMMHLKNSMHNGSAAAAAAAAAAVAGVDLYKDVPYGKGKNTQSLQQLYKVHACLQVNVNILNAGLNPK